MADPGFPRGGGANSPREVPTYDFAIFSRKLYEIERIWAPLTPPPRSATGSGNLCFLDIFLSDPLRVLIDGFKGRLSGTGAPLSVQFLSLSCSFWEKIWPNNRLAPPFGIGTPSGKSLIRHWYLIMYLSDNSLTSVL